MRCTYKLSIDPEHLHVAGGDSLILAAAFFYSLVRQKIKDAELLVMHGKHTSNMENFTCAKRLAGLWSMLIGEQGFCAMHNRNLITTS